MDTVTDAMSETLLSNNFGEQFLYSVNGDSFIKSSSSTIYEALIGDELWSEDAYHIVIGTDSGLLIQYIVEHGIPENAIYLFIELPQYIDMIRPELPIEWQKRLKFCTPQQWLDGYDSSSSNAYFYNERIKIHYSVSVIDVKLLQYSTARIDIEFTFQNKSHEIHGNFGNYWFIKRQLQNVSDNIYSSALLNGAFKGKTCVILGGGPSLDEHLPWIKANKDKLVIIAASRVAKRLLVEGFSPHIIVSIDPQDVSYDISKEALQLDSNVLLINSFHVVPKLLAQWHGKSVYLGKRLPWQSDINVCHDQVGGPTVTNSALVCAINMGFSQILLTGADLCYSPSGATHASSSYEEKIGADLSRQQPWVETYKGERAETVVNLVFAGKALSMQAAAGLHRGCTIYNLSENAAKIDNVGFIDYEKIELETLLEPPTDIFKRLIPIFSSQDNQQDNNVIDNEFDKVQRDLVAIKKIAEEAIIANQQMCDSSSTEKKQSQCKHRLDQIENLLSTRYEYMTSFLKKLAVKEFVKILGDSDPQHWTNEQIEKKGYLYYRAYLVAVATLQHLLKSAQQRLEIRIEQTKSQPNMKQLISYWQQQQEFSCLALWMNRYVNNEAPFVNGLVDELARLKSQQIEYHQTIDFAFAEFQYSLSGVSKKIRTLYLEENKQGLSLLNQQLKSVIGDEDEVASLTMMSKAYLMHLQGEVASSYKLFTKVDTGFLGESEYKIMASQVLTLELYVEAESILAKLSEDIPLHQPLYANILKINGKGEQAIEAYSIYLEQFNTDKKVWCELGELFFERGAIESAKMAFDFVKQLSPQHTVADFWLEKIKLVQS